MQTVAWRIEAEREIHTVYTNTPQLDPAWKYTDRKGHKHYVDKAARGDKRLPTLRWIVDIPSDDEYPEQGHWKCRQCREHIEPGTYIPSVPMHIPGMTTYTLIVEHVDNDWLLTSKVYVTEAEARSIQAGDLEPVSFVTEDRVINQTARTL